MKIEYDPTSRNYLLDARITTKARAVAAIRAKGLTCRKADVLLRTVKLCATVNGYFEEPEPEPIACEYFHRFFRHMLANVLDRQLSLLKAERWLRANVRPGKVRRSVGSLKHDCDHAFQRIGSACYLREGDFADVLRRCGYVVKNGEVRIEETPA
jgi:hypothetical protein